jgi:hypothetical protein
MIEVIYQLGFISSLAFLGIIFISCLFAQLSYSAYHWVNDKKCERLGLFKKITFTNDLALVFVMCFVIVIVASLAWPLAYPGIIIFGILCAIRKFKRFQKKVTSAFNDKADKKHTHIQSDIKK